MAPLNIITKIIQYYTKDPKRDLPIISASTAAGLAILYTFIYVIPFYLSSKTRPSPQLSRDAPSVIRARIRAVFFSCLVTGAITSYVGLHYGEFTPAELLRTFGLWPIHLLDLVKSLVLVAVLFLGPLFERGIVEGEWRDWVRGRAAFESFSSYVGWRTYVAGPVSEEFVWRAMIIPLHLFAKIPPTKIVFVTPLYFGIAHVHHCYEYKLTHPDTPLLPAVLRSLFQFAYTSIFGFFAAFVFLRTGSLWAAVLTHAFCNWMGLPRFWGRVETPVAVGPPDVYRKEDLDVLRQGPLDEAQLPPSDKSSVAWTVAYYLLLVAGAVEFYRYLFPLTHSQFTLVPNWPER